MMKRKISWLFGLLISFSSQAQEFTYEAGIEPVSASGYYSVVLSPELLAKLRADFSDIRIYTADGKEQPYLLRKEQAVSTTSLFNEYEITEKIYKEDQISHLIFKNPDNEPIDNITFLVKNTDVQKRARLSGSEDGERWFVIKNNYLLHSMRSEEETSEFKILNFPMSDYSYFKLEINDNWKLPINILKVGNYDTRREKGLTTSFICPISEQKDSLKKSYFTIEFPEDTYVEKLNFEVSEADFFSRHTTIKMKKERLNRKKKTIQYFETLGSFNLNSNSINEVDLGGESVKTLYVEMENRDNQPLKVDSIKGSFLNRYLVVALNPGEKYTLKFGDQNLKSPDYDIIKFANQIPNDAKRITHGNMISLKEEVVENTEDGLLNSPYLIWVVIGAVGLILAFVSFKMIGEIGAK
ncbi:MAG: hypothetical protein ABJF11_13050 [Reichenbachiella sp.]|uniref:hypothetical protein n=1 Tax=Reichenbachiella sp. TaxID=2184521 RepID=UPI00326375CE